MILPYINSLQTASYTNFLNRLRRGFQSASFLALIPLGLKASFYFGTRILKLDPSFCAFASWPAPCYMSVFIMHAAWFIPLYETFTSVTSLFADEMVSLLAGRKFYCGKLACNDAISFYAVRTSDSSMFALVLTNWVYILPLWIWPRESTSVGDGCFILENCHGFAKLLTC